MGGTPSVPQVDLQQDRTFVITGANTGIGYETAKKIAQYGGRVIMACRSEEKAKEAIERMKQETQIESAETMEKSERNPPSDFKEAPSLNVQYMHLDLSKLQSVMDFIKKYKESGLPINVLICNAGMIIDKKVMTEDGFEMIFQVNYLSHLLLTLHLLPLIKQSGPNSRIVNIASKAHFLAEVNLDNIQAQKNFFGTKFYANSKLYQIMSMYQLAKILDKDTISLFSVHPGFVETNILNYNATFFYNIMTGAAIRMGFARKPTTGAIGPLMAALDPSFNGQTAVYISEERPKNPFAKARDEANQEIIWNYSLECLKEYLNDDILGEIGMKMDDIKTVKHSVRDCEGTDVDKIERNDDKEGTSGTCQDGADSTKGNGETQKGDDDTQNVKVDTQKGDVDPQKGDVAPQKDDVDTQKGDADTQKGDVDTQKVDVDTQKGDADTQKGDVDRDKGDVDTQKGDIDNDRADDDKKKIDVEVQGDVNKNEETE